MRLGHRNVAAGCMRVDGAVDPSERNVAARSLCVHLPVEIGDGDVTARGGEVDVVLRGNVDHEVDVELRVPVKPRGGMVVASPDADVVSFLNKVEVEILEKLLGRRTARRPCATNDVDADVGGAGGDFDVADISIDDDGAAGADVEVAVDGTLDRSM